jgi:hypothetical protein
MDTSTVVWIIVAIVVVLLIVAAVVAASRRAAAKKAERDRERAGELRAQAEATQQGIRKHQAESDAAEARAQEMRAQADRKVAEAKRLEAEAQDRRSTLHEHVERRDEVLRQADELDPDVDLEDEDRGADSGDVRAADDSESRSAGHHRR